MHSDSTARQLRTGVLTAWRGPGSLQLTWPGHALTLDNVPDEMAVLVDRLKDPHTKHDLGAATPKLDRKWIDWLWAHLSRAQLLQAYDSPHARSVRVLGAGRLACALRAALRGAGLTVIAYDKGWTDNDPDQLIVVAPETVQADRGLTRQLIGTQTPHLIARIEPGRAVVGPAWLPGQAGCLHCIDLAQADQDRAWPHVLAQLCRTRVSPEPRLLSWATTTATMQAAAWAAGAQPEVSGRTLELHLPGYRLHVTTWARHPHCVCGQD